MVTTQGIGVIATPVAGGDIIRVDSGMELKRRFGYTSSGGIMFNYDGQATLFDRNNGSTEYTVTRAPDDCLQLRTDETIVDGSLLATALLKWGITMKEGHTYGITDDQRWRTEKSRFNDVAGKTHPRLELRNSDGKQISLNFDRVAAVAFPVPYATAKPYLDAGKALADLIVSHKDGDRSNHTPGSLFWNTPSDAKQRRDAERAKKRQKV